MSAYDPTIRAAIEGETIAVRAGAHLQDLAARVRDLEVLIGRHYRECPSASDDFLRGMQELDYIHQSLTDLSQLVPKFDPPKADTSVLNEMVRLESTRNLIAGQDERKSSASSGIVDLF